MCDQNPPSCFSLNTPPPSCDHQQGEPLVPEGSTLQHSSPSLPSFCPPSLLVSLMSCDSPRRVRKQRPSGNPISVGTVRPSLADFPSCSLLESECCCGSSSALFKRHHQRRWRRATEHSVLFRRRAGRLDYLCLFLRRLRVRLSPVFLPTWPPKHARAASPLT